LKSSSVHFGVNTKTNTKNPTSTTKYPWRSMFRENTYREDFKTHLKRLGYSKGSQNMLPACVAEFLQQLEEKNINTLQAIKPIHIGQHYEYLTQRPNKRKPGGLSDKMITHHIYAIRLFLNYHEQTGHIKENPISGLNFPSPDSKQREVLTTQEIKQLYEVTQDFKEKAILGLYYGCGLRRSEGAALDVKDIHFESSLLYVRKGKGGKRRVVPVNNKVLFDLKNYLYKGRLGMPDETAFICNCAGKRMKGDKHNTTVKQLVSKAGIQKEITLHNLRHSIATHLLENGMSVEYVRDFLGHKHLESTQVYTRISKRRLRGL